MTDTLLSPERYAAIRARLHPMVPFRCAEPLDIDEARDLLAAFDQITRERDEIRKLAKVLSLEDAVLNAPDGESDMQMRLRWFAAIADLRVELACVKAQPGMVQKACEAAVANLVRAEEAEAALVVLTQREQRVNALIAQWRGSADAIIEDVNNGEAPVNEADIAGGWKQCADDLEKALGLLGSPGPEDAPR